MIHSDIRIHAENDWANRSIEVRLMDFAQKTFAQPIVMSPAKGGDYVPPMFRLDVNAAQQLMDSLWTCGVRPTEGQGSAGSLAATQKHLDDMRALFFAKQNVSLPGAK